MTRRLTPRLRCLADLIALRVRVFLIAHQIHTHHRSMNPTVSAPALIGLLARHGLGLLSGAMLGDGVVSADQLNTAAGAVTALVVVAWSIWQKKRAAKAAN